MNKAAKILTSLLILSVLMACNKDDPSDPIKVPSDRYSDSEGRGVKTIFPNSEYANIITVDTVNPEGTIRARSSTALGELVVIAIGQEEEGHLNTPSTAGVEGDYTFQGNYKVINKINGKKQVVNELKELSFIQTSKEPISFEKVNFEEADVYFLTPQYTGGHGLSAYAFVVNKDNGEAAPLKFVNHGATTDTLNYAMEHFPFNKNGYLIVTPGTSAGTSEAKAETVQYRLDVVNQYFIAD